MITADDIRVSDAALARRVLLYATTVAPCLPTLEGEAKESALAILGSIAVELTNASGRRVKSRERGEWKIAYFSDAEIASIISADDRAALRWLCGNGSASRGPIGRFPRPRRPLERMWPEEY